MPMPMPAMRPGLGGSLWDYARSGFDKARRIYGSTPPSQENQPMDLLDRGPALDLAAEQDTLGRNAIDRGDRPSLEQLDNPRVAPPRAFTRARPGSRDVPDDYDIISNPLPPLKNDQPFQELRQATGSLAPMMNRYGLSGYGNVEEGTGERGPSNIFPGAGARAGTKVTMYGDPVDAEVRRLQQVRQRAIDSRAANDMYMRSQLGPETRAFREGPAAAAAALESGSRAFNNANPIPDEPAMDSNVERAAVLRDFFARADSARAARHADAVGGAETTMDPTVTRGRATLRDEALADAQAKQEAGIAEELAGNTNYVPDQPVVDRYLGGESQAGAAPRTVTLSEIERTARRLRIPVDQMIESLQREGVTIRGR